MAVGLKIVNGDYVIKEDGSLDTLTGSRKCARDFEKMLKTESVNFNLDPNNSRYNPYYGTQLYNKDMLKGLSPSTIIDVLNSTLKTSIDYYIKLQEQRNNLSVNEVISDIQYIVYQDPTNKQQIIINFKITNGSGSTFNIEQYI